MSATTLLTFEQFEQLQEAPGKRELIDGEVIEMPPPKFRHTKVAQRLYDALRAATPGERTLQEAGYRIAEGWVQPDVSVTEPDHRLEAGYLIGAPALAIEILSPRNTAGQIERKLTLYFSEGADEVWVVDPDKRSMTVYRRVGEEVHRLAIRDRYAAAHFDVTIVLDQLFAV
jgi:Uma2 family endonuclease